MGYFSNGTEGMVYEDQYCSRCIHCGDENGPICPIMAAHSLYNYEQLEPSKKELKGVLALLIPEDKKGLHNEQCKMFVEAAKVHAGPLPEHLRAWGKKQGLVELRGDQFAIKP